MAGVLIVRLSLPPPLQRHPQILINASTEKPMATTEQNGKDSNTVKSMSMGSPSKRSNGAIALASATAALGLFAVARGGIISGVTLGDLAANAIPYNEALANGRPTVLEFYADWCEVCRELAPDVYKVEQEYKDAVNFVMLNVDNSRWEEELDEFGVEGIPHLVFLDKDGNEEGNVVGRLPRQYLEDNVSALAKGGTKVPHTRVVGRFSSTDSRQAPPIADPLSHGNF